MLNEKEKYHQSIALELRNKMNRLGFFLKYENGSVYHKFLIGIEEGLSIEDQNKLLKKLFLKEAHKTVIWDLFILDILKCDPIRYMEMNEINTNSRNESISNKEKEEIINHFFETNQLTTNSILEVKDRTIEITPRNIQNYPEGNYREYLLIEHLRKTLPSTVNVGTGFIINETYHTTNQIDIIIYDGNIAPLFQSSDLVVVVPESVYGIIEVKTTHYPSRLKEELEKAEENFDLINRSIGPEKHRDIFSGIFYFNSELTPKNIKEGCTTLSVLRDFQQNNNSVNNIAFGDSIFVRKFDEYSFYDLSKGNLAFAYFISNLVDTIMVQKGFSSKALTKFIFPIEELGGKETRKIMSKE